MRRRLVVSGRVQGVGFRYFVREYARELGLSGRVRNLRDGSVEVEAEGEPDAVEQLVSHLHRGPQGSTITAIEDKPVEDAGTQLPNPFAIAR